MAKPRIVCVVGTRPDAIKSAPVILELQKFSEQVDTVVIATGQHVEMLRGALKSFGVTEDVNLEIMQQGQTLADITRRTLEGLDAYFAKNSVQMVIAQGDTTTTFVAGLGAFYRQIPFAHVEAGLRTDSIWNPFPEEFNRRAVSLFARWHFAPTAVSKHNLLQESVPADLIKVTGNTGIDAVLLAAKNSHRNWYPDFPGRIVLLTTHRRENWGEPQHDICRAVVRLLESFEDIKVVVPMHKNPAVRAILNEHFGNNPRIDLIEPPDFDEFVSLLKRSDLILSDSGGIQEEAPAFGKPVLVLRENTERPEGVTAGVAALVGTNANLIFDTASKLLSDTNAYSKMSQAQSPYGDGRAAARIRFHVLSSLGISSQGEDEWT